MPKEMIGVVRITEMALVKYRDGRGNTGTRVCIKANGKWGSVFGNENDVARVKPLSAWLEKSIEGGLASSGPDMEIEEDPDDEMVEVD